MKTHKLLDSSHFESLCREKQDAVSLRREWIHQGKGDPQAVHGSLCWLSFELGCIALILGHGDQEALGYFQSADGYAVEWLRAPGTTSQPRVYDVELRVSERRVQTTAIHERKPVSREPSKLSVIDYSRILFVVAAFGNESQIADVAKLPEDGYANPNVVAGADVYGHLRVWRAWLSGDPRGAQAEGLMVLRAAPRGNSASLVSALLAIAGGDREGFARQLEEHLSWHRKQYQRQPNMPEGFVSLAGLALCRQALERGIVVEDQAYLPVRLLPNYRPVVH